MNTDDRVIHENVTALRSRREGLVPILPYQVERRPRTPDEQIRNILYELDDLHAEQGRITARVMVLQIGIVALVWHVVGFWPLPWFWQWAATSYQTIFVAVGLIGFAAAGLLAVVPSLLKRCGWMS